ncbi:SDR family oxidoreductase [bacterium]|nr:SDR family oxidoreductase [bacterium]
MKNLFDITGKTALVTGGSRGIGLMIAKGFVEAGARVYIASRKTAVCNEVAQELSQSGACVAISADLSSEAGVKALGDAIRERETSLNILVNNAGATWGEPFETFPESAWDKVLALNVKAPFFLARELMSLLKKGASADDPSRIINIGSISGLGTGGSAFSYGASKAAIHQMTRNWAYQFARDQITVNCIAPGTFPSKMTDFIMENESYIKTLISDIPLGRFGTAEDAAGLAIFLSSRAAAWMTGNIIPVDGGEMVRPSNSLL